MAARHKPGKLDADALWSYALSLLGRRSRSTGELKQKLLTRAASFADVGAVLKKLAEYGFTDDIKFSETFAEARLRNQRFGAARILRDLQMRRVPTQLAKRAVNTTFAGVDEQDLIAQFLDRKYRGKDLSQLLSEEKNVASVYRRLRTAGFSAQGAITALKKRASVRDDFEPSPEE